VTERPVVPTVYLVVCVVLLALTALTTVVGRVHLGAWNLPVALAIAIVKALLVAMFFMQLRRADAQSRLAFAGAILWLLILFLGSMDDYVTRTWMTLPGK
jgi:cytochrome c oxidase subunit 4